MRTTLEGAVPPPHLHPITTSSWPTYNSHYYQPVPSPGPMTPESVSSYAPRLHDSPLPSREGGVPSSGWFAPAVSAPKYQNVGAYGAFSYNQSYVTPQTSSDPFSPHQQIPQLPGASVPASSIEQSAGNYSPISQCSSGSDGSQQKFISTSDTLSPGANVCVPIDTASMRPHSSQGDQPQWAVNPLTIQTSTMHQHFYSNSTYPSVRSPRLSEPAMELQNDLTVPQHRRLYAPIAPHPRAPSTSAPKRSRDDDEDQTELLKRRKRSDSNTSAITMELGEEDRLLIQLKDEESMPWKDIAARFQSDLGKTYQIPALQMRLKRLRERMRVWTDTDVKALRMAHEYWVQNKFDIISQKMLEYGAAEKWTARQCARKWVEIDPGPTPYTTYDHHMPTYTPYTMSPVEAHHFMPYVHIQ